jgi:hypothetical protein
MIAIPVGPRQSFAVVGSVGYFRKYPNITVAFLLLSARAERPPGELYARVTMR